MDKIQSHMILLTLFLILFIHHSSLLISTAYTLPLEYFINCGSDSSVTIHDRRFVGDPTFFVGRTNKSVEDTGKSAGKEKLYQTARVFLRPPSGYQFEINQNGTYMVRLHFFVFSASYNLSNALFSVQASEFPLLSNFSIPQNRSLPVIEEFLLTLYVGKFAIVFIPSKQSPLAFVNAIEVFLAPPSFIPDKATDVTIGGGTGNYSGLLSRALHTIYRINVGGDNISEGLDRLWRTWIPDDEFLYDPKSAKNRTPYQDEIRYRDEGSGRYGESTVYVAPDAVYKTAKQLMNTNFSNITWDFSVSKNARYLVRAHFCDIISPYPDVLEFKFFIYSKFHVVIYPYVNTSCGTGCPFYSDFLVDSDNSGLINVSVHVIPRQPGRIQEAFLNGLEIMEMMGKSGLDSLDMLSKLKRHNRSIMVGSLSGAGAFLLAFIAAVLVFLKLKRVKAVKTVGTPFSMLFYRWSSHNRLAERAGNLSLDADMKLALKLPYAEIQRATKNFDENQVIGKGGFGKVYKGILREGLKVAVKRSEPGHGQGLLEFQTEIVVLSQIRHRHLVSLIGYCDDKSEMILVYEYMEKGTLREHLYTSDEYSERYSRLPKLTWEQRLKICIDAARGLHYLHTGLQRRIIHRDVKSTNILLSEHLVAKVADFGLSKSGPFDHDQEITGVKGSFGYLDPEYFSTLQLTEKSDVYSFGVVLLEVLCARSAILASNQREEVNLAEWGMHWQKKGELGKIIDPFLVGKIKPDSLRKFSETAEKCLKANSDERPNMNDVVWDLRFALQLQQTSDEYSITSSSSEFALHGVHHLPSHIPVEDDDPHLGGDDGTTVTLASGVFSQLIRIVSGR